MVVRSWYAPWKFVSDASQFSILTGFWIHERKITRSFVSTAKTLDLQILHLSFCYPLVQIVVLNVLKVVSLLKTSSIKELVQMNRSNPVLAEPISDGSVVHGLVVASEL